LIKEKGKIKALGAGLASSFGELNFAFSKDAKLSAFDPEIIGQKKESPTRFHNEYFVLESLDELEEWVNHGRF